MERISELSFFHKFLTIGVVALLMSFTSANLTKTHSSAWAKEAGHCFSARWPHEKSDLTPDPALIFGRLPNGFRYVIMRNSEPKDRVSLHLNIQAGSLNEREDQRGLAHFLEHMTFNGSDNFPPGELIKYFQSIGMAFGDDANAHTGLSETVYDVLLPSGTEADIRKGFVVMRDYARGALLLESEVERERGIILAEKRTRDSVGYRTYVETMKFLFSGTRIPDRLPIGEEAVIRKADRKLLKAYYDSWYRPENMILVMVGDFDPATAESLIKSEFPNLSTGMPVPNCPDAGKVGHEGTKTFHHFESEAGNAKTALQVVWNTEPRSDSLSFQKELVTEYLANGILNNRLEAMVENPDNPFTSASVYSGIFLNRLGYAKLSAKSAPENWKKVLTLLEQTLRQALRFGFSESELERVKKDFIADLEAAVLEKDTRNSEEIAGMLIDTLNDDKVFQSPEQEKEIYAPFVRSLTPEQVNEAFSKVWNRNHRLILLTGNARIEDENPEKAIREVFDASAKTEVERPEAEKAIIFPYLPEPETPGKMRQRTEIFDLGIEQIDFENGVRLNLKKTDFKKNEVIVSLSFGPGRKAEPAPGLAMLAEAVLNKSGLGGLTENELDRALAGKNTHASFHIRDDSFLLKGESVSEEVPLLFQLLHAHLNDPGCREEAYRLAMREFGQMYRSMSHSIDGAMELSGERFLAGGDSRFGVPPREDFEKLTLGQVRSWMESAEKGRPEISLVGDFDPESVKKLAARYFGSLPIRKDVGEKKESLSFPAGERLDIRVETTINKGVALIAWPTTDFSDIWRVRRLSVLGHVFSERMREQIREELGATYSQYAYNHSSRTYADYGVFRGVMFIKPDMSEKIILEVKKIAADLAGKGISEEELRRAADPILTSIKDMMRTNEYWLSTVLDGSLRNPEQLEWSRSVRDDYAAVTVGDISRMAKTYLDKENPAVIVIKPVAKNK